jgi:hypothetical protein
MIWYVLELPRKLLILIKRDLTNSPDPAQAVQGRPKPSASKKLFCMKKNNKTCRRPLSGMKTISFREVRQNSAKNSRTSETTKDEYGPKQLTWGDTYG